MALTISYDGYGVVANADLKTNDTGGSGTGDWKELGGGTISENPDVYLFSGASTPASIGSKYASKTGYTFIDGITALDFTPTTGAQEGEMIYCWINIQSAGAFAPLSTNGLAVMIGSATGDSYEWKIAGSDDANGWTGGWKLFVIDPQNNTGTVQNGSPVLSAVDTIGIWIDTDVSVRADSIFQSQIICTKGLAVTGTPTVTGEGLDEVVNWATDYANRAAGVFQKRGNTYYSLGSLTVGNGSTATTLSATGNNVEYEESSFWNGSAWISSMPSTSNHITTTANAALLFQDTGVSGFIDNKLALDTSTGNASSITGGYLKYMRSITVKSTDTFDNVVFSLNDALSLGTASYDGCTFNDSGTLSITSSTGFTNNSFNSGAGVTAVLSDTPRALSGHTFNSTGTGHGLEITGTAANMTLTDVDFTGYAGTDGSTGNEAVYINIASGSMNLTISGGTTPSVRTAGCEITKVVGAVNVTAQSVSGDGSAVNDAIIHLEASGTTMSPFPVNDTVIIVNSGTTATVDHPSHGISTNDKVVIRGASLSANLGVFQITVTDPDTYTYTMGSTPGSSPTGTIKSTFVVLNGLPTAGQNTITMSRSFPSSQLVIGSIRKSSEAPYYKPAPLSGTVSNSVDTTFTGVMISDD